ncbi:MAG: hypothetical protein CVV20_02930 [Gemmatimonadetes bacterium HGW-Gemmatimonadetes-1]|nr:MAG: hypothetical protein CVV20_02930 [Gemmatimonadetes bacterium HGW-Gemmatimonadetes-1]
MMRLFLLLALALGQAQPVAAAMLCGQHHAGAEESRGRDAGHHGGPLAAETTAPGDHDCTPTPHDCAVMTGCAITAPAIVPVPDEVPAPGSLDLVSTNYLLRTPPSVSSPRPFHPPKS